MKRLHLLLTVKDSASNVPKNLEARRRLEFFSNSLFMNMPSAKPVSEMLPFRYVQVMRIVCSEVPFLTSPHINHSILSSVVSVFSPHTIVKLCFIVLQNCKRRMKTEYLFFSIFKRYFQVMCLLCFTLLLPLRIE